MKLSLAILILLTVVACVPQPVVSPPSDLPPPTFPATEVPGVINSTSLPVCVCPGSGVTPDQSQSTLRHGLPIICNCPAIIVPPPVLATQVGPNPQEIPPGGITLTDNGMVFTLHPGESFLLDLGNQFDWTVNIDDPNVLSRVKNVLVIVGAQGIYTADNPGQAILTALGDPLCRRSTPPCEAPSILFKITVTVQ